MSTLVRLQLGTAEGGLTARESFERLTRKLGAPPLSKRRTSTALSCALRSWMVVGVEHPTGPSSDGVYSVRAKHLEKYEDASFIGDWRYSFKGFAVTRFIVSGSVRQAKRWNGVKGNEKTPWTTVKETIHPTVQGGRGYIAWVRWRFWGAIMTAFSSWCRFFISCFFIMLGVFLLCIFYY